MPKGQGRAVSRKRAKDFEGRQSPDQETQAAHVNQLGHLQRNPASKTLYFHLLENGHNVLIRMEQDGLLLSAWKLPQFRCKWTMPEMRMTPSRVLQCLVCPTVSATKCRCPVPYWRKRSDPYTKFLLPSFSRSSPHVKSAPQRPPTWLALPYLWLSLGSRNHTCYIYLKMSKFCTDQPLILSNFRSLLPDLSQNYKAPGPAACYC